MNNINFSYCPTLGKLLGSKEIKGCTGKRFSNLGAISSLNTLMTLRSLILNIKPSRTIEIGLSFGGSCLVFLASHRDIGHLPEKQHIAIDPFQKSVWDDAGLMHVKMENLEDWLDFYEEYSYSRLPLLVNSKREFDLVYIDGSHIFEDVFIDFYYVWHLLSNNGIVIFDDQTYPHINKVIKFIRTNLKDYFIEYDLSIYRPDKGLSLKYKIAKMFNKTQLIAFMKIDNAQRPWDTIYVNF